MYKQNLKLYFIINKDKCAKQIKIHILKLQILLRNPSVQYVSSHMFCSKVKRLFKYYSQHSNALTSLKTILTNVLFKFIYLSKDCVYICRGACMSWGMCGGLKIICGSWSSPSTSKF